MRRRLLLPSWLLGMLLAGCTQSTVPRPSAASSEPSSRAPTPAAFDAEALENEALEAVRADPRTADLAGALAAERATVEVATLCDGDPRTATWKRFDLDRRTKEPVTPNTCYWPTMSDGEGSFSDDIVRLDLLEMSLCHTGHPGSGEPATLLEQRSGMLPLDFYLRLSALDRVTSIRIAARTALGQTAGGWTFEGWDAWRPLWEGPVEEGHVVTLGGRAVLADAEHLVELEVELLDARAATVGRRLFSIHWAIAC